MHRNTHTDKERVRKINSTSMYRKTIKLANTAFWAGIHGNRSCLQNGALFLFHQRRCFFTEKAKELDVHKMYLVKDLIQNQLIYTIDPGSRLDEALRIMLSHHIRHLPVVDLKTNNLLGIITDRDLRLASYSPVLEPNIDLRENIRKLHQHKVSEAMAKNLLTVNDDDTILDACKLMRISKYVLPVVKKDTTQLIGLLTHSTMLDHLIRYMEPLYESSKKA